MSETINNGGLARLVQLSEVTDDILDAVEYEVGMGCGAWDCVPPKEIIAAAWKFMPPTKPGTELFAGIQALIQIREALGDPYGKLMQNELVDKVLNLIQGEKELRERLDWQNMPNRREPLRGGYEFYVNEEWVCLRNAALGEDVGFQATLMKVRYDPDDERVRVRRVIDDDAILHELAALKSAVETFETLNKSKKQ